MNPEAIQRKSLKKPLKAKLNKASKIGMGFSPSFWDKTSRGALAEYLHSGFG
jgi:hypothetical protein